MRINSEVLPDCKDQLIKINKIRDNNSKIFLATADN